MKKQGRLIENGMQTQTFSVCVLQCVSARTKKWKREREKHTATVSITKTVSESKDGRLAVGDGWEVCEPDAGWRERAGDWGGYVID